MGHAHIALAVAASLAGCGGAEPQRGIGDRGRPPDPAPTVTAEPDGILAEAEALAAPRTASGSGESGASLACPEPMPWRDASPMTFGGVVVDARGAPVRGARVAVHSRAMDEDRRSPCFALEAEGTTDRDGRFELALQRFEIYEYPRWIEASSGDLFGRQVVIPVESNHNLRVVVHRTQPLDVEIRCSDAPTIRGAGDHSLPSGPALSVFSGSDTGSLQPIALPRRASAPDVFGAVLRLRPGEHHLLFSGVCGVHVESLRVRASSAPAPVSLTLPRADAGAIELVFDEEHIFLAHMFADRLYVRTLLRRDGSTRRLEGLAPGRYRFAPYWGARERACLHDVDVLPGRTSRVELRFQACAHPPRGPRAIEPRLR